MWGQGKIDLILKLRIENMKSFEQHKKLTIKFYITVR